MAMQSQLEAEKEVATQLNKLMDQMTQLAGRRSESTLEDCKLLSMILSRVIYFGLSDYDDEFCSTNFGFVSN